MAIIEKDIATTFKFTVNSNYGTLTEADFELHTSLGSTKEYYTNTDVTYTIVQPVAGVSDGSLSVELTPTTIGLLKVALYKVGTGKSVRLNMITAKVVETVTTITSVYKI